jgi:hypothetical protein
MHYECKAPQNLCTCTAATSERHGRRGTDDTPGQTDSTSLTLPEQQPGCRGARSDY